MTSEIERFEGPVSGAEAQWNQSYYYQAYDPGTRCGVFIRIGLLENQQEANSWLIVFREGRPLFTRTNLNLPYVSERPLGGMEIAGMRIRAEVPLKRTHVEFVSRDFSLDLTWNELHPMVDCIQMSQDHDGSFAREMAQIHLEGTATVTGTLTHRGEGIAFSGKGFRDIAAGARNWDGLSHYRLAWPIFDDGSALACVHGISTGGHSAYLRMFHDGKRWLRIKSVDDQMDFDAEGFSITGARWRFVDENDQAHEFTAKPLFRWLFPLDTFVLCEQLAEFRLSDGTLGYGLYETGYRLPWKGQSEPVKA